MPYLGRITITGPEPEVARRQHFVDILSATMVERWSSVFALVLSSDDTRDSAEPVTPLRKVLDHRIIGYASGASITAIMDGDGLDFEEAVAALASLGRHLTTWSPELLEYTLQRVEVSRLDHRWDQDNWLPPLNHERRPFTTARSAAPSWSRQEVELPNPSSPPIPLLQNDLEIRPAKQHRATRAIREPIMASCFLLNVNDQVSTSSLCLEVNAP